MSVDLLLVEDEPLDVELIGDALRRAGVDPRLRCVEDEPGFRSSLALKRPDAILADWTLPSFSGARALEIARLEVPEVPFLFVSGTIAEHTALEALRNGAVDYVFKHQLERLASSVSRWRWGWATSRSKGSGSAPWCTTSASSPSPAKSSPSPPL